MVKMNLHDFPHITIIVKDNSYYDTSYYESFDIIYNSFGYIVVLKAGLCEKYNYDDNKLYRRYVLPF